MARQLVVVSYDIADDRQRQRLSKVLCSYGQRVQYSVFECWLDEGELAELRRRLARYVRGVGDSVRIYRLCGLCVERVETIGDATAPEEPPGHWVV